MEEEKKEVRISEEEYAKLKRSKEKIKVATIVSIFTVVLMIGLIVLLCIGGKENNPSNNGNGEANNTNNETKYVNTFKYDNGGSYGIAYVKGYVKVHREPYCGAVGECAEEEASSINDEVTFYLTETESDEFKKELDSYYGEGYTGSKTINLGCVENEVIVYTNAADEYYDSTNTTPSYFKSFSLSKEDSKKIIESTETNPVLLKLEMKKFTHGMEGPACYSHFTTIEVVK